MTSRSPSRPPTHVKVKFVNKDPLGSESPFLKPFPNPLALLALIIKSIVADDLGPVSQQSDDKLQISYDDEGDQGNTDPIGDVDAPDDDASDDGCATLAFIRLKKLTLVLRPMDGIAYTAGPKSIREIHLSSQYVLDRSLALPNPKDFKREIEGVLWHEMVHAIQHDGRGTAPGGLIEGIADLVRWRHFLAPPHWRNRWQPPGDDANWDDGYESTAYFLLFIEEQAQPPVARFAQRLNALLRHEAWSEEMVARIAGEDGAKWTLASLWTSYLTGIRGPTDPDTLDRMPWVTVNLVDSSTALVASLYSGAASHALVRSCVRNVQRTLFDRTYDSPAGIRALTVFMREMDGVAYCTGSAAEKEIHLSTAHVANVSKGCGHAPGTPEHDARVRAEIEGVLVHEAVHAFQANASGSAPGGLIEGIADAVRLRCGLAPPHWRRGTDGGRRKWDSGYDATAFFLQFIEEEGEPPLPGFLKTLNMIMADPLWTWDESIFELLTGRSLSRLWREYKLFCGEDDGEGKRVASGGGDRGEWPVPEIFVEVSEPESGSTATTLAPLLAAISDEKTKLKEACVFAMQSLYKSPSSPSLPYIRSLHFSITDSAAASPAAAGPLVECTVLNDGAATNNTAVESSPHAPARLVRISASYLAALPAHLQRRELEGLTMHALGHVYVAGDVGVSPPHAGAAKPPRWLVEGVCDWLRLKAGREADHWRTRPTPSTGGARWDEGFGTTAKFLAWIDGRHPGFVQGLNTAIGNASEADGRWDDGVFVDLTGRKVEELWRLYVASVETCVVS